MRLAECGRDSVQVALMTTLHWTVSRGMIQSTMSGQQSSLCRVRAVESVSRHSVVNSMLSADMTAVIT